MAPHVTSNFTTRAVFPGEEDTGLSPTIVAGIIVAAVIAAGLAIWLAIRWYRKKSRAQREKLRVSAFVNYGESGHDDMSEKGSLPRCASVPPSPGIQSRSTAGSYV